jgi:toxin ParE1/3/4
MGFKIIYSKNANEDIKAIYNYIRKDSIYYAKKEVSSIYSAIERLENNPFLGKRFEKFDDELTREMIFKNYRIIYYIIQDIELQILSIHHHARLISNNPAFKTDE